MSKKVHKLDAEDFQWLLGEISRGACIRANDFLSLRQYAKEIPEQHDLLNALINGYAVHQDRIIETMKENEEMKRTVRAVKSLVNRYNKDLEKKGVKN